MAIQGSDLFILQRPTSYSGGHSSSDVFSVTATQIGEFTVAFGNAAFQDHEVRLTKIESEQAFINGEVTALSAIVKDHDDLIVNHGINIGVLDTAIGETNKRIDNALTRAKINVYFELVKDKNPGVGQMSVWKSDTALAKNFTEAKKFRYNYVDKDGTPAAFANIFAGETLEITGTNNTVSTLEHRAIYYITDLGVVLNSSGDPSEYFDIHVELREYNGTGGLPEYQEALDNPTRSDFYPIFSVQQEDIDDLMKGYIPLTGAHDGISDVGPITGKLQIKSTRAKLDLAGEQGSDVTYLNVLKFKNRSDNTLMELQESKVKVYQTLSMESKQIKNLSAPSEPSDACTRGYVDEALDQF